MQMKDTPKALEDWKQGMTMDDIARKYGLADKTQAIIAVQTGYNYLKLKGVNQGESEGTVRVQKEPG